MEPARPEPSRRARETPRLLKLQQRPDGYQAVFLTGDDGVRKCIKVHRLVLFAWFGEPPEDQVYGRWEASHMSGVRNDNRLDNVAWEPPKLNFRRQTPHDRRANSYRRGEQNHNAKLTAEKAQAIRERYAAGGVTQYQLADEYGVSQSAIGAMLNGRTWKQPGEAA